MLKALLLVTLIFVPQSSPFHLQPPSRTHLPPLSSLRDSQAAAKKHGAYLLGAVLLGNIWLFSIPPTLRHTHFCLGPTDSITRSYNCVTGNEWLRDLKSYYKGGGGFHLDFSIDQHPPTRYPSVTSSAAVTTNAAPPPAATPPPAAAVSDGEVYDEIKGLMSKYYVEPTRIIEPLPARPDYKALLKSLHDKYSRYLTPSQYAEIQKYDLVGVGVMLIPDGGNTLIVGAPPIPGSSAANAGVVAGDKILEVNEVGVEGKSVFDVIDLIAPDAATLTMKVQTSSGQPKTVTLKRKVVKVSDPVTYSSKVGKDGLRIGYIRISEFNAMVPSTLPVAINALESLNCDEYLLDLRGNPGGSFQSAIEIAGLFVQDKVAVNVVDGSGKPSVFKTADVPPLVNSEKPVAIWLDENSASASEVLSGALQDNCRGVTIGTRSFGKGLIQGVYGLKNGGGVVLTVGKYETPRGQVIQGKGVRMDIQESLDILPGISKGIESVDFGEVRRIEKMCRGNE